MLSESKIHYKRNILISIILSELLIIAVFIFSPENSDSNEKKLYDEPIVLYNEIPRTVQSLPVQMSRPEVPAIYISDEPEAFQLLEDVSLASNEQQQTNVVSAESAHLNKVQTAASAPRQIFEVVPADRDNEFTGRLQLSLKINEKGQVVDHRIIYNSLDCAECLYEIIKAAYKSRWEPGYVNGKSTDYWVMKSYIFN